MSKPARHDEILGADVAELAGLVGILFIIYAPQAQSPLMLLAAGGFIVVAAVSDVIGRRAYARHCHRQRSGLCVECGYDLRATPDRCPECGTVRK